MAPAAIPLEAMSIRDIRPGSSPYNAAPLDPVGEARSNPASAEASAQPAAPAEQQDRLELSAAARSQQAAPEAGDPAELERARKALLGMPPLDPKRAEDIILRVQEGFYSQPDVLKQIAEGVQSALAGQQPDE